jgi:hypothetical protein
MPVLFTAMYTKGSSASLVTLPTNFTAGVPQPLEEWALEGTEDSVRYVSCFRFWPDTPLCYSQISLCPAQQFLSTLL